MGYKILKIIIYLVCILGFPILIKYLIYDLFNLQIDIPLYVIYSLGVIIGGLIAIVLIISKKYQKIYMGIMGGAFGYFIGTFLYDSLLSLIQTSFQKGLYYLVLIICCIIGIVTGLLFQRIVFC